MGPKPINSSRTTLKTVSRSPGRKVQMGTLVPLFKELRDHFTALLGGDLLGFQRSSDIGL